MKIPSDPEYSDVMIQGVELKMPILVTAADFADTLVAVPAETAADLLQQTLADAIRSNFGKTVTKAVLTTAKKLGLTLEKISDIPENAAETVAEAIDKAPLQKALIEYVTKYEPGTRKTPTEMPLSPVEREAMAIATESIKDHLKARGIGVTNRSETFKVWSTQIKAETGLSGGDYIIHTAKQMIEANPAIRTQAEAIVAARQKVTAEISYDIKTVETAAEAAEAA